MTSGTIYLGYPVLSTADDRVFVDALLVSQEHGLAAFVLADGLPGKNGGWERFSEEQDNLYAVLESYLGKHPSLRRDRKLAFDIKTITVFAADPGAPPDSVLGHYCDIGDVTKLVDAFDPIDPLVEQSLQAAIQRVTTIKPAKRRESVTINGSRGAVLRVIEKGIANLDLWQKRAAIETPEGPQRIRGLAGSGKTVVLALKAAYLHTQHPDWTIALTFKTRALYQQLDDLATRFSFEHSNDRPDPSRLRIMHSWGSSNRDGVYSTIARHVGVTPRDFAYASSTYGREDPFSGVCGELLAATSDSDVEPLFDAVLIDEAQDLPPEFFQLVYRFTRDPKRIVWAFDELQKLSESAMPSTDELFGLTPAGESRVTLIDRDEEPRRDIVLPRCYRNTPWCLATAHALGFGIYRPDGLVQHFDEPQLWEDIGYKVLSGDLSLGNAVRLERSKMSYPEYFPELLSQDDAVVLKTFVDEETQDRWVAQEIVRNLDSDELEHDDILIVLPDAYTAKRRSVRLSKALLHVGIDSHLAGVASSVDELFVPGSIAIAHIHRAKGNEAPMVYAIDSQFANSPPNLITRRNTLFTALTRSRAWVRVCGWGHEMEGVAAEIERVRAEDYVLDFSIPTTEELERLRRIHRDRSSAEMASVKRATKNARELLAALSRDELDIDDLPPELRTGLLRLVREELQDEDE